MAYTCSLHNWHSFDFPCPPCHVTVTTATDIISQQSISPSKSLEQEAQDYAEKVNPFVWPKNKSGEPISQRVGQRAPGSGKHRLINDKIKTAYIAGASRTTSITEEVIKELEGRNPYSEDQEFCSEEIGFIRCVSILREILKDKTKTL